LGYSHHHLTNKDLKQQRTKMKTFEKHPIHYLQKMQVQIENVLHMFFQISLSLAYLDANY
jgi:hypothetical protein